MDKAPDFGSGDYRFESCQGRTIYVHEFNFFHQETNKKLSSQPNTLFEGQINCLFVIYPHVNISISVCAVCADVSNLRMVISYTVLYITQCPVAITKDGTDAASLTLLF
jgi:hypothetical protein